jgi:hypothetical protein
MPRVCAVCTSDLREEIEERLINNWTRIGIYQYLVEKYGKDYPGLPPYKAICNHAKHFSALVHRMSSSEKGILKQVERELTMQLSISRQLTLNLRNLQAQAEALYKLDRSLKDPQVRKELRDIIGRINETITICLKFFDRVFKKPKEEDEVRKRLEYCLQDLPAEAIEKVLQRWDEYEKGRELQTENRQDQASTLSP